MSIATELDNKVDICIHDKVDEAFEKMINDTYSIALGLVLEGYDGQEALREALRRTGW